MPIKKTFPAVAEKITVRNDGTLDVPNQPIIPFIEGDGIGPDIWAPTQHVIDSAIAKAYGDERKIHWLEIFAGEKAIAHYGDNQWLPNETLEAISDYVVAIKGPLTTPIGEGIRSLNVAIRQKLNLYACIRPVRYFPGCPSPMKNPEKLDVVIFRENTEDVYCGIEWKAGSKEAIAAVEFINQNTLDGKSLPHSTTTGIGIKPVSKPHSERLIRMAIKYAIAHNRKSVTFVHKGNIMKFTEGAFCDWGFAMAHDIFSDRICLEDDIKSGKIIIKDRIADAMFQQLLLRPDEYDVLATTNLNGDYLSDACAAQVGGLGVAPGANIGDKAAVFEATHGTAPKYAGQDKVNPSSLILSAAMLLEHLGWNKANKLVIQGMTRAIKNKQVTYDFHRQMDDATLCKSSEFGEAIIEHM